MDPGLITAPARRLAAVLFADIVGFTTLTAEDDTRAFQLASALQASARDSVAREGGRVVRFVGDAVLAEFSSAEGAVRSAFSLAREFERASAAAGLPGTLHTGVHVGELTAAPDGDIYGNAVNLAARLQAEAAPRQILVSDDVCRQLRSCRDFVFEHAGTRSLKGIAEAVTVHVVHARAAGDRGEDATSPGPAVIERPRRAELAPTRLIVLPFRMLRPDAEIDFLSFGLADAITATLSGLRSLVVRSSLAAVRYAGEPPDLKAIGNDAAVDLVLSGTLLRAADRVRVTAQLADVATGTVLWSESQQVPLGDLFQLQDDLTQHVVSSVATPLTARERRMIRRDVPATARAYELYLRANQIGAVANDWVIPRDLYRAALDEDPDYAPAWAQLGRCYRLLAKYGSDRDGARQDAARAEEAFARSLELNPDLPLAHNFYAQLEVERGRPREAMERLIGRVAMGARDAQIFVGLVHALRYCGLLEESLAAHEIARRLDPNVATSVEYTLIASRRYEEALEATETGRGDVRDMALVALGRIDDARSWVNAQLERYSTGPANTTTVYLQAVRTGLDGDAAAAAALVRPVIEVFPDLEGHFSVARWLAYFGAIEDSIALMRGVVAGYYCEDALRHDPWLEPLRAHPEFPALLERAAAGRDRALTSFLESNGPELLDQS